MKQAKVIPERKLFVAILDDDDWGTSLRHLNVRHFQAIFKQPEEDNIFITNKVRDFISFADKHSNAVLFCDPGALGQSLRHGVEFKQDNILSAWLEDNPSRIIHVPFLLPPDYYSFRTFKLEHQVNFFGTDFQWHINHIFYEWFFENNPLALFQKDWFDISAMNSYLKKAKGHLVFKIAKKLNVSSDTVKGAKKAISDYYNDKWKQSMKRRGVKGF